MATVLAEVDGNAVGPAELGLVGRADGVGLARVRVHAAIPRLADGGDVIDVHSELDHGQS